MPKRINLYLALVALCLIPALAGAASTSRSASEAMLDAYRAAYPEIRFVHLRDVEDMDRLDDIMMELGAEAENIDYQHPPSARDLLRMAQIGRITEMLRSRMPSATLFRQGADGTVATPYTCIITLDERVFTGDRLASTRFFSDGQPVSVGAEINNAQFVLYTLDHEVFHCLDAYANGPTRPQTFSKLTACYNDFRAEQRADYYAAVSHRLREADDSLPLNLARFRALAILDWDLPHYTVPALEAAVAADLGEFAGFDIPARVARAMQLGDTLVMPEQHHREMVAAAVEVALDHGVGEVAFSSLFLELAEEGHKADPAEIDRLKTIVDTARLELKPARLARSERN